MRHLHKIVQHYIHMIHLKVHNFNTGHQTWLYSNSLQYRDYNNTNTVSQGQASLTLVTTIV